MNSLRRLQFLYSASFAGWPVLLLLAVNATASPHPVQLLEQLHESRPYAVAVQGDTPTTIRVEGRWTHGVWSGVVRNDSDQAVALREIILFEAPHGLPAGVPADVVASDVRSRAATSEGMQSICKDLYGFRVL